MQKGGRVSRFWGFRVYVGGQREGRVGSGGHQTSNWTGAGGEAARHAWEGGGMRPEGHKPVSTQHKPP